ncbi:hypothetical protein AJ79_09898 [Helicocarpus griseus UAMH5409]|uniref:Uncharacterized protein n=1 Tax=Helicocarpus griseus UAMH5409 TaxID=1447875 RepID=A0A2B7WG85_9EURO|nr:hypothetical protein AJ79_09898 [Helicocarpus griseus UAMH5409]
MRRWTRVRFNGIGSLYYAEDTDTSFGEPLYFEEGNSVCNSRLKIGPSSNREWSDEGRRETQCDRGPWLSVLDYRRAIGNREVTAVKTLKHKPKHLAMLCGPEPLYQPTIEKKLEALHYEGPDVGDNLERPTLPAEIKSLKGEEKATALQQYMDKKAVMIAWRSLIRDKNPAQYRAIQFQRSASGNLLHLSRRIFELGEAQFFFRWQVAAMEADVERAELGVRETKRIEQRLGSLWPEKGVVEHEGYDEAKSLLRDVKKETIARYETHSGWDTETFERLWPFDE